MNRLIKTLLLPVAAIVVFVFYDKHISTQYAFIAWVIFFPVRFLAWSGAALHLREDQAIFFTLSLGIPLLFLYWYCAFRFVAKHREN